MLKKIMMTLGGLVLLIGTSFGGLWLYTQSQAPQTEGERKLLALCLYGAGGQSRENCQCVMERARGKLTDEEMQPAWEIQLGSRQAGVLDEEWQMAEEDRREAEFVVRHGSLSRQDARRIKREILEEARAPQSRLRTIINGIVSDCGFRTE